MPFILILFAVLALGLVVWQMARVARLLRRRQQARALLRIPEEAEKLRKQGRMSDAVSLLQKGLEQPAPLTQAIRLPLHLRLSGLYQAEGRFADAEAQARAALESFRQSEAKPKPARVKRSSTAAIEAELFRRLADALDAQGKTDEARALFSRSEASTLVGATNNPLVMDQRAQQLARDGKHTDAAHLFLQAVEAGKDWKPEVSAHTLNRATLSFYNAGRYQEGLDSVRKALSTLENTHADEIRLLALRQGANCAIGLTEIATAQTFVDEAQTLALSRTQPRDIARILLLQAHLYLIKGELDQCDRTISDAMSLSTQEEAIADAFRYEVDMLRGDYAKALARVQTPVEGTLNYAYLQRRRGGAYALAEAQTLNAMERYMEARGALIPAEKEFASDERMRLTCRAVHLRTDAALYAPGARESLITFFADLERQVQARGDDATSRRDTLMQVARGFQSLGEFDRALHVWQCYQNARPRPVYLPACWYYIGECHAALGNPEAAHAAWQKAIGLHIDTHHARLAHEKLITSS